ncbi:hypothetical protein CRM22_010727 [Opisthorchis felineus]|uniref:SCP domain-containing protein n=1 Tax=Opisthorchis felineus TaxID=147828 RepID=A0A4S2KU37_OPIFE|nr:hypothetical protein CRM22_010727 [Opisthorchis felineus]
MSSQVFTLFQVLSVALCIDAPQNYERYLEEHNKYRKMVLDGRKWSAPLALLAQRSAEECNFEITENPTTNANKAASPEHDYDVVNAWFDQHTHYKYGPFSTVDASHFEGYTQLIWSNTREVGCHRHLCARFWTGQAWRQNMYFTVCQYYPRGNVQGEKPYKADKETTVAHTPTEYLEKHNTYRTRLLRGDVSRQLQPRIMPNLTWNPSLASEAEASASRCRVNSNEIPASENIFTSVSSTTEPNIPGEKPYEIAKPGSEDSSTNPHDSRLTYLDRHNTYRVMILEGKVSGQPQALLMPNLTWSDSLEQEARLQAEMCDSTTRSLPGESRAISRVADLDVVKHWFDQHTHYTFGRFPGEHSTQILGYTQLVWADTLEVGCYQAHCQNFRTRFNWATRIYSTVCRYWPAGNVDRGMPYQQQRPVFSTGKSSYNEKIAYLTNHNKYRNMVLEGQVPGQPQATVMPSLRWSDKLEQEAMHEAEKCVIRRETLPGEMRTYSRDENFDFRPQQGGLSEQAQYVPDHDVARQSARSTTGVCVAQFVPSNTGLINMYTTNMVDIRQKILTKCRVTHRGNVEKELPYEHKKEAHPVGDTPANPEEKGWLDQHNTYRAMLLGGQVPGQPIPLKMPNLVSLTMHISKEFAPKFCEPTNPVLFMGYGNSAL